LMAPEMGPVATTSRRRLPRPTFDGPKIGTSYNFHFKHSFVVKPLMAPEMGASYNGSRDHGASPWP